MLNGRLRGRRKGRLEFFGETEKGRRALSEMDVCTAEETGFDVARLGTTIDQSGGLEVIEAPIEGAHGLQRATREELAAGEDGGEWLGSVDGTGEGRENRASTRRDLFDMGGPECSTEDDPR
jgi:hypothetical protein